jgi:hypothetical protein
MIHKKTVNYCPWGEAGGYHFEMIKPKKNYWKQGCQKDNYFFHLKWRQKKMILNSLGNH